MAAAVTPGLKKLWCGMEMNWNDCRLSYLSGDDVGLLGSRLINKTKIIYKRKCGIDILAKGDKLFTNVPIFNFQPPF